MEKAKACFEYETYHEGENKILRIYAEHCTFPPSIEYSTICMSKVIDILLQNRGITTIIISQLREYEYDAPQTALLTELAELYRKLTSHEREQYAQLIADPTTEQYIRGVYTQFQQLLGQQLKEDPLNAYKELKRLGRHQKVTYENTLDPRQAQSLQKFIEMVAEVVHKIGELQIIKLLLPHQKEYSLHDRRIYTTIFHPSTRPDFMYTRLQSEFPEGELLESYQFSADGDECQVNVFRFENDIKKMYHITPPEFRFEEQIYALLDDAKRIMAEHTPGREEFVNPERMREVFRNIGKDLLRDLATQRNLNLSEEKLSKVANALLRYTVGFGVVELLLSDPSIQDVNINSPNGSLPVFIVHEKYGDCYTNVYPTRLEVESWATKLRLLSGRPLDEANPILDTELNVEGFSSRVAAITAPLNPSGLAFSFRRHRDNPWTFPLYMQENVNYMNATAAGLLSFLIDNSATILIAGTRSSGKTSLLGSVLVEIMRTTRLLTVEDTFELPQESLRALGYNIESLKVASALSSPGSEVEASIGIRSTLRLGDSALIVGEVRSSEAKSLFEAMRVGAAANVVAGTIHADSPYGVFDRVVNDIGVPKTSFKAIDIIIVTNPVISGLRKMKRVLKITEVRKEWENDPLEEGAFVDLMVYNPHTDQLEITDDLRNGNSMILKRMAGRIKEFAGNWDAIWENIELRANCKQVLVDVAKEHNTATLLEAQSVINANDQFHIISDSVMQQKGKIVPQDVLFQFTQWVKQEVKKIQAKSL